METTLAEAGTNRQELVTALLRVPESQREGLQFLLTNMPSRDAQGLSADYLLENLALAHQAMQEAPWAKSIPQPVFLNDILPYASMNERRDHWRKRLYEICQPLVKDCRTASEAGIALNKQLFTLLNVRYSRQRRAADQGPLETMESGVATCTGLSILLVDACRSVGVPARIVATPMWSNGSGNHTWVEIWDGDWHFTGAAEQDPNGLDRGWFVGNASQAVKDDRNKAIYASSFLKTGLNFPLPWARRVEYVSAVNVTDRYTAVANPPDSSTSRLLVDVFNRPVGERVTAKVVVTAAADPTVRFEGESKGETADMNDHLSFRVPKAQTYLVETQRDTYQTRQHFTVGTNAEDRLVAFLSGIPLVPPPPKPAPAAPSKTKPLTSKVEASLKKTLTAFFVAPTNQQSAWKFPRNLERLLRRNEPAVRRVAWEAFREAPIHSVDRQDYDARQVRFEKHLSPYTVRSVGVRPPNGWPLVIAMHGGGGVPKEVNDSQWRSMQRYYRDHPEVGGYLYLALRAPNNEWNGFYTGYVYPLIQNLVRQFLLFGDVDPNKVFLMGYSHGGYGAFAIGPKMPDRFAAIHASAAAPSDGSSPMTLRNTYFSCMLGEKDTMYGRFNLIQAFEKEVCALRGERTDIYPITVQMIADHPHSGLPDRDKIVDIYPAVRNAAPPELTWRMTDNVVHDFYWLRVANPVAGQQLDVICRGNRLTVTTPATTNLAEAVVFLDSRLIDFRKPVIVEFNGRTSRMRLKPSLRTLCETLQRRCDPELAFTASLPLPLATP